MLGIKDQGGIIVIEDSNMTTKTTGAADPLNKLNPRADLDFTERLWKFSLGKWHLVSFNTNHALM
jgi:hypothetical protein